MQPEMSRRQRQYGDLKNLTGSDFDAILREVTHGEHFYVDGKLDVSKWTGATHAVNETIKLLIRDGFLVMTAE